MENRVIVCADLLENETETIENILNEKLYVDFPKLPTNAKAISGTFGTFNVNEMPDFRSEYQQLQRKPEYELYRYKLHTEMKFGQTCYLKLNHCELTFRIKAETPINHRPYFRKTYKDYGEFLKEWERAEE